MKIQRDIPSQLIIESRPVVITILLSVMALAFIGVGVGMLFTEEKWFGLLWLGFSIPFFGLFFVLFVRRNQLILDAGAGTATHRRKSLIGYTQTVRELEHLGGAVVESSRSSEGGTTYRMTLIYKGGMDAGHHPFTLAYTSGGGARRGADAVNRWLDARRARG